MTGIRADANEIIATGHIMRCITIAGQLKKRGEDVLFFLADEYPVPMLRDAGMEYVCLYTKWDEMEEELPAFLPALEKTGCDRLLVDSYQATAVYLRELKKGYKVIYIDDLFEQAVPADMIINYNAYHVRFPYEEAYHKNGNGRGTRLLLGTAYVPLREEFSHSEEFSPGEKFASGGNERAGEYKRAGKNGNDREGGAQEVFQVLLSCGGGDVHNALAGILERAVCRDSLRNMVFHTVVGRFNKNEKELRRLSGEHANIVLHDRVEHMAELMGRCDAAVSAAGTVLFELCAMQLPAVFFVCAENQKYDSGFFEKEERMLFAGDIRIDRKGCVDRICGGLERLSADAGLRNRMKRRLHEVTDGRGAARIAEEMLKL